MIDLTTDVLAVCKTPTQKQCISLFYFQFIKESHYVDTWLRVYHFIYLYRVYIWIEQKGPDTSYIVLSVKGRIKQIRRAGPMIRWGRGRGEERANDQVKERWGEGQWSGEERERWGEGQWSGEGEGEVRREPMIRWRRGEERANDQVKRGRGEERANDQVKRGRGEKRANDQVKRRSEDRTVII